MSPLSTWHTFVWLCHSLSQSPASILSEIASIERRRECLKKESIAKGRPDVQGPQSVPSQASIVDRGSSARGRAASNPSAQRERPHNRHRRSQLVDDSPSRFLIRPWATPTFKKCLSPVAR